MQDEDKGGSSVIYFGSKCNSLLAPNLISRISLP